MKNCFFTCLCNCPSISKSSLSSSLSLLRVCTGLLAKPRGYPSPQIRIWRPRTLGPMHHLSSSTPPHILLCNIFQYLCNISQYLCNIFQYFCDIFQYIQISMQYLCIASSTPPHICLRNIFHFQNRYWFVLVSTCIRICFDSYPSFLTSHNYQQKCGAQMAYSCILCTCPLTCTDREKVWWERKYYRDPQIHNFCP